MIRQLILFNSSKFCILKRRIKQEDKEKLSQIQHWKHGTLKKKIMIKAEKNVADKEIQKKITKSFNSFKIYIAHSWVGEEDGIEFFSFNQRAE